MRERLGVIPDDATVPGALVSPSVSGSSAPVTGRLPTHTRYFEEIPLMEQPGQTLHDFVLNLLTDQPSLSAFQADPESALAGAGLSDISASDVHEIVPLVMDYVPMHAPDGFGDALDALPTGSFAQGQDAAIAQLQQVAQAFTGQAGGDFATATSYTDPFSGSEGAASFAAGPADGFAGTGSLTSPLGDALFSGAATPQGQFTFGGSYSESHTGTDATTSFAGGMDSGVTGGGAVTSPLGDGNVSFAGTTDGQFTDSAHFANDALHAGGDGAFSGSLSDGLEARGEFTSPLGDSDFSLSLPGAGDLPTPGGMGAPLGEQYSTDGTNTLASALANPAAGGLANPADALSSLAGNVPAPAGDVLSQNPLGNLPTAAGGGAAPQAQVPAAHPASGVADTATHAVDQVTSHAQVPGLSGNAPMAQHAANPLGQAGSAVHHTLGTVTDQLHGAASGMMPQAPTGDPTQSLHSAAGSVTDGLNHAASHSPLGGDSAGVSSTVNHVTDAMEHNSVTDAAHDLGANGLDGLHL